MIRLEFTPEPNAVDSVKVIFEINDDHLTAHQLTQIFRRFMLAMTYTPTTVDRYIEAE